MIVCGGITEAEKVFVDFAPYQIVRSISDCRRFSSAVTSGVLVTREEADIILSAGSLFIVSGNAVERRAISGVIP